MTDIQLSVAEEMQQEPSAKPFAMFIKPWMIMLIAILAISGMAGVSAWVLLNDPTEGERSQIIESWQTVGIAAFFYFLGSSAGSRNASAQKDEVA